jgi:hypothetical protein
VIPAGLLVSIGELAVYGVAIAALVVALGRVRWARGTRELRARLAAARSPAASTARFGAAALAGLPAPVAGYLLSALTERQPWVAAAHLFHSGTLNTGTTTPQWKPFTSDQRVTATPPGFDWDARIVMAPGLPAHVHDAYVGGEGVLLATLLGLVPLANQRGGGELARGELMRFLAEAVWWPTALVPQAGAGVRWEAIDNTSARATLADRGNEVALTFRFGEAGMIDTVRAEARGRTVGARTEPTPWQGRFWNYARKEGMLVPLDAEVAWMLPAGPWPYWRGHVERVTYEFAP